VNSATKFATTQSKSTDYHIYDSSSQRLRLGRLTSVPAVVVVDQRIVEHHPDKLGALTEDLNMLGTLAIAGGEQSKSVDRLLEILTFLRNVDMPKHGVLIAVGGGTVCDITGVASQLFRRGVPLVLAPTTLLAQTDAAIGGKNGLNFGANKNLIGGFHHPEAVLCDVAYLTTLTNLQTTCGIAECLKVFAVSDELALFRFFSSHPKSILDFGGSLGDLVALAVRRKLDLLAEDPFEFSSRRLLNYGHAFAHSFEERSGFRLSHGEAVLIGMTIENMVSKRLGIAKDDVDEIQAIIDSYFTPACLNYWIEADEVPTLLKELRCARRGQLNVVCIEGCGKASIIDDERDDTFLSAWNGAHLVLQRALARAAAPDLPLRAVDLELAQARASAP
jgi:3-dehydroquinate synthase